VAGLVVVQEISALTRIFVRWRTLCAGWFFSGGRSALFDRSSGALKHHHTGYEAPICRRAMGVHSETGCGEVINGCGRAAILSLPKRDGEEGRR